MKEPDKELIQTMLNAIERCLSISKEFKNLIELLKNKLIYDNLLSNLIVIYESETKISKEFKTRFYFFDWSIINKYKELVFNDYTEINNDLIWQIVIEQLPTFKEMLTKIINNK
jgi:uncharacterized protein with HEPN domain